MNKIDLSQIKKASVDYRNMSVSLTQNHKGKWNDSVHDSFVNYNRQIKASSETVSRIYDSTKDIADTSLDNIDLIARANRVLSEVETI